MKIWNKYPSVTIGGKQFFYRAKTEQGWYTVVWNRATQTWHAEFPMSHLLPSVLER